MDPAPHYPARSATLAHAGGVIRHLTKKKWAWKGDVLDAEDGKKTASELAFRDARVSANEADEARSIQWIES